MRRLANGVSQTEHFSMIKARYALRPASVRARVKVRPAAALTTRSPASVQGPLTGLKEANSAHGECPHYMSRHISMRIYCRRRVDAPAQDHSFPLSRPVPRCPPAQYAPSRAQHERSYSPAFHQEAQTHARRAAQPHRPARRPQRLLRARQARRTCCARRGAPFPN
jgi:hypothetical protein